MYGVNRNISWRACHVGHKARVRGRRRKRITNRITSFRRLDPLQSGVSSDIKEKRWDRLYLNSNFFKTLFNSSPNRTLAKIPVKYFRGSTGESLLSIDQKVPNSIPGSAVEFFLVRIINNKSTN